MLPRASRHVSRIGLSPESRLGRRLVMFETLVWSPFRSIDPPTFREELGQGGLGRTRRGGVKLPYDPVRLIDIGSLVWIINTGKL